MSKVYFMLQDEKTATNEVTELKSEGVDEDAIGVLARDKDSIDSIPVAEPSETSDFEPAVVQGVAVGGGTGVL